MPLVEVAPEKLLAVVREVSEQTGGSYVDWSSITEVSRRTGHLFLPKSAASWPKTALCGLGVDVSRLLWPLDNSIAPSA